MSRLTDIYDICDMFVMRLCIKDQHGENYEFQSILHASSLV